MLVLQLKHRNFQAHQEYMMTSLRKCGMYQFFRAWFPKTSVGEVDTVPRFTRITNTSFGAGDAEPPL